MDGSYLNCFLQIGRGECIVRFHGGNKLDRWRFTILHTLFERDLGSSWPRSDRQVHRYTICVNSWSTSLLRGMHNVPFFTVLLINISYW